MTRLGTTESAALTETDSTCTKETNTSPNGKRSPSIEIIENGLIQELSNNGLDTLVECDVEKAEDKNGIQDDKEEDLVSTSFYCDIL